MVQPQFLMLTQAPARWINLNEIRQAVVNDRDNTITLHLQDGTDYLVQDRQNIQYVQAMMNSLSALPPLERRQ